MIGLTATDDGFRLAREPGADSDKLPRPDMIAQEIVDDLEAALERAESLQRSGLVLLK